MTKLALIGDLHLDERSPRYRHVLEVLDWTIEDAMAAASGDTLVWALLGDLFESTPSGSELAELLTRVKRMAKRGVVILIEGNHEAYDGLAPFDLFADNVVAAWRSPILQIVTGAVILAIPYARRGRPPFDGIEHDGTIQGSMVATANEISRLVQGAAQRYQGRLIVLGHWTIQGMKVKDAEFEIHNATEVVVPQSAFAGVALAAVGHIHTPQDVAANIIGVGSLIRHSFAEVDDAKSYTMVTIDKDGSGPVTWERRAVPCREMVIETLTWPVSGDRPTLMVANVWEGLRGKEVKLIVEIREDQLATFDPEIFAPVRDVAALFVWDKRTIPVERTRAPQIAKATTLAEQLTTWLDVTNQRPEPPRMERLVAKTSEVQG